MNECQRFNIAPIMLRADMLYMLFRGALTTMHSARYHQTWLNLCVSYTQIHSFIHSAYCYGRLCLCVCVSVTLVNHAQSFELRILGLGA
jgi:hypothetical protein